MAIERKFIKEGIKEAQIETFLNEKFDRAGYSHSKIERTPVGTRIVVYANKPGLIIGRSGSRVRRITEEIKEKFDYENPLVDVREIENPFLDATIVAKRIANSLERGIHYKRVCNYYLHKVMEVGAVGIQIRVAGKVAGVSRSRFKKFRAGFIAHSGDYAEKLVDVGYAQAVLRPGIGGIRVKIMKEKSQEVMVEELIDKIEDKPPLEDEEEKTKKPKKKTKKKKSKKKKKSDKVDEDKKENKDQKSENEDSKKEK